MKLAKGTKSLLLIALTLLIASSVLQAGLHPSYSPKAVIDSVPFYTNGNYDKSIPEPNYYLQHPLGTWPMRYHEMAAYIKILVERSDRMTMETHGATHEGREMYNIFVSSPENIANFQSHVVSMDRVADPASDLTGVALDNAVDGLPAFAWLGYSIHGDELSGVDAAVQLLYHLAAANDSATLHLLENVIIIIDPNENPDGRERYLSMLQTHKSHVPNWDSRSAQHNGVWPWGRTNHYLFDMNRDWMVLTQPETRGRVQTIVKYHPVMCVDAHEMGSNATYLFSPPREPINYNMPSNVAKWYPVFSKDQATAFDQRGWPYYTGEWNDQWYIGYGSAWPTFTGAVGILYEQAGVDGAFVRQSNDYLLSYHESVNHQFSSSLANLHTTANNRVELLKDYRQVRKDIVARGEKDRLTFLIAPDRDELKINRFIESLLMQGIEVQQATSSFTVSSAVDVYAEKHSNKEFPTGTYIVSTAQAHGALAKTIMEFDLHLKKDFLEEERRELEKHGDTRMYEVSAWCVPMAYDLEAYQTFSQFNATTRVVQQVTLSPGQLINPDASYGFIVDMVGEKTFLALNRIFQEELIVYASEKAFTIEGHSFQSGALVLHRRGNIQHLTEALTKIADEIGINIYGVNTGFSTKGSHLGAPTFRLLRQPRVGLCFGAPLNYTGVGSLWHTIDRELEIPHSLLSMEWFEGADLSPYNVLILPASWGSLADRLGKSGKEKLARWVRNGGTLILEGSSAAWAADSNVALSNVRLKRQMLDKLDVYDRALDRELAAEKPVVDTMALWHPEETKVAEKEEEKPLRAKLGKEEAEELDRWNRRFRPRGVIMRADIDTEYWLAFGMRERVPVMAWSRNAFLADQSVTTVARFTSDKNRLRLSGLLWPEARERWAGTAYVTRERKGKGQIIMFAGAPNLRAHWHGTRKMFVNAVLYGPGFVSAFSPYGE
ncbi:MAG: hypothetical protein KOO62_06520 [candidate division Zixibacteria bacterium]|nr:hypothetical protein [candidate division Zixibacteria bacterium]